MVATQLQTTPISSSQVVVVEGVEPLETTLRVRLRQAICAAGPQDDSSEFEAIAKFFFALQEKLDKIAELHQRFNDAKHIDEETQIIELIWPLREAVKPIELQPEKVLKYQDCLDAGDEAAAHARKLVAELLDKHLLIQKDGHVCPNISVQHVRVAACIK